jgi:hypothetical protein
MWYVGPVRIVEKNYGLVFTSFFFATLAFITVGLRMYTRAVIVKNVGLDDCLMVVAMVSDGQSWYYGEI